MDIKLNDNGIITEYTFFGKYMDGNDGIYRYFPENNSKSGWYEHLKTESVCIAAMCIGALVFDYINANNTFKENNNDTYEVLNKNKNSFLDFTDQWFTADGAAFSEPNFLDFNFGRFSGHGDMGYQENEEALPGDELIWKKGKMKMLFEDNKITFDDTCGKIFIDSKIQEKFQSQFESIVELFKS